jgi:NAD(P)-dependent dehydrogenase (short-subunit alcohol dehydrogenase family)
VARDDNLQLREFPTLTHVIGWIRERAGIPAPDDTASQPTPAATGGVAAVAADVTATAGPAPEAAAAASPAAVDEVTDAVVSIVSEMTGYPPELLDLDLDLEADLGVDTVKQAEVFAAVRDRFGVARDDNLQLREFPTLTHVIGWIRERAGIPAPGAAPVQPAPSVPPAAGDLSAATTPDLSEPAATDATAEAEATNRYPRRVPVPVLRPALEACKPTGARLDQLSRVVIGTDAGGVAGRLAEQLDDRRVSSLLLDTALPTNELLSELERWLAEGPVDGIYWLPALDDEGSLDEMDLPRWREALRRRVKNLYAVSHRVFDQAPFLVAATRLGGLHGYEDEGARAPLGGAVTGFAKAYSRERPDALVKVVDFTAECEGAVAAEVLVAETLSDPGCVEVGHADGLRWSIGLVERPFGAGGGITLGPDNIFVITGAAGSIVSAITADLAAASSGTFHLLDLTPAPDSADPDLQRFSTDRDGLKADIATRLKTNGERPTPVRIEKELARYERLHAALAAIEAVEKAGGTAHYHEVDLTDAQAVRAVIDDVRAMSGRIDVVLHAAGLEVSRSLGEKEAQEFDLVFDVKSDGWFNIMNAAGDMPVGTTVAFSSIAGRFGNNGQTDYSSANDLLCKLASSFRRTRPGTRAIAVDWTAWSSIGMASRGSIPKVMEMAGIEMLDPAVGVPWVRHELTSGDIGGEVVVAGALGVLGEEYDETGGVDLDRIQPEPSGPMIGAVRSAGVHSGLIVETLLDPARQPFLNDHRIDGTAVLPGVMGIEGFAEVARLLAPKWHVVAVENVEFLAPVKFYRDEPRTVTLRAVVRRDGTDLVAQCALGAERQLVGASEPQRTTHFTGSVRLAANPPLPEHEDPVAVPESAVTADDVYALYFHGPAYQVVDSAWSYDGGDAARFADGLPANHDPAELSTLASPRFIELCFQAVGLCEAAWYDRLALPRHVDRVRVIQDAAHLSGPFYARARQREDCFDCAVVDVHGEVAVRVEGYRGIPMPGGIADEVRRPLVAAIARERG